MLPALKALFYPPIKMGIPGGVPSDARAHTLHQPLFNNLPRANQVGQGWYGDCFIVSATAAIAAQNPGFFLTKLHDNQDGTVTVRGSNMTITEDKQVSWETKDRHSQYAGTPEGDGLPFGGEDPTGKSSWFPLLEKAFAIRAGSYQALANNGMGQVFDTFAGGHEQYRVDGDAWTKTKQALTSGKAAIAATGGSPGMGLFPDHGYAILAMSNDTITLQNPYHQRARYANNTAPEPSGVNHLGNLDDGTFVLTRQQFLANYSWIMASNNAVR